MDRLANSVAELPSLLHASADHTDDMHTLLLPQHGDGVLDQRLRRGYMPTALAVRDGRICWLAFERVTDAQRPVCFFIQGVHEAMLTLRSGSDHAQLMPAREFCVGVGNPDLPPI